MTEGKLLGVCAWLSDKFELDVTGIRILFLVAIFLGFGSPIILYLILRLLKPRVKENKYVVFTEKQLEALGKVRDKNITENDTIEKENTHNRK